MMVCSIIWLLHNLVEASFDLFGYLLLGDQLIPWELAMKVSYPHAVQALVQELEVAQESSCAMAEASEALAVAQVSEVLIGRRWRPVTTASL